MNFKSVFAAASILAFASAVAHAAKLEADQLGPNAAYTNLGMPTASAVHLSFPSRTALKAIPAPPTGTVATTAGYAAPGDGGAATYVFDAASTLPAKGPFVFTAASGSGMWSLQVPAEGVHPEAAGSKCDYNMTTFAGTDDTTTLNNLSGWLQNNGAGNGNIVWSPGKTCLVNSGSVTVNRGVKFSGVGTPFTSNGGNPQAFVPAIALNPAYSLICSASATIENMVVWRAGLALKPSTAEDVYNYIHNTLTDASIGINNNASDCRLKNIAAIGFHKDFYSTGGARLIAEDLQCDGWHCLEITANADTSYVNRVRGYPFWSFNLNGLIFAYGATPTTGGSGYTTTAALTVPGGVCTTQPTFTPTLSGNTVASLAVLDSGSCTTSPQTWGLNSLPTILGGGTGYAASSTFNVTLFGGTPNTATVVSVTTNASGVVTTVNSVVTVGSYPQIGLPQPYASTTGGSGTGLQLYAPMTKNPITLTGGLGTGAKATINTEDIGYRGGNCLNMHDGADGADVHGVECEEYQVQAKLSNIWNSKLFYVGGEGGYANADHGMIGIQTANCVSDTTIYSPNSDANLYSLYLAHADTAHGGNCVGSTNQSANLVVFGGHLGYNPGYTAATVVTTAGSNGILSGVTMGWPGINTGWPVAVQIQPNSLLWQISSLTFDFFNPTAASQWISLGTGAQLSITAPWSVYTIGTLLPACTAATQGSKGFVTNGASPTFMGSVGATGSVFAPISCLPSGWVYG